ncbi:MULTISPECIES: DUF226 domain-containing protein [Borreliella]|uniref:DUF226 domain-containing protein n=1 Tax=Borreliella TaxID=64895 RepID=UPI001FCC0293|nr:DUF226 domain-containing protein [Borreliella bavariensis]WLN24659.1 DUF226 domain-containing protein [Borreliella bavariensis]
MNGTTKSYGLSKAHYIEFRFKKGSVFCYFKGLFRLLKKGKTRIYYNIAYIDIFIKLEKHVCGFYAKNI